MARLPAPYESVTALLRERIERGQYKPGERIPSAREICTEFGISIATAARVLRELGAADLTYSVPGRGTFVGPASR